jgi:hypothetical protein
MPRRPSTFTASDVTRAVKATVKAGLIVDRVEVQTDGTILVHTGEKGTDANGNVSEFEKWRAKKNARSSQRT